MSWSFCSIIPIIIPSPSFQGRVRLMKGLVDSPICYVEDNTERQRPPSAPSGRDFGQGFRPPGSTRYGSNTDKDVAAVGVGMTKQYDQEYQYNYSVLTVCMIYICTHSVH